MPQETEHFRCPCCGQHAPVERLLNEGPFELALFQKKLGGKHKLTPEERADRKAGFFLPGGSFAGDGRGSGRGRLEYEEIPLTNEVREAFEKRKGEV